MTILLSLTQATDLHALSLAVYRALRPTRPDLAREAAALEGRARDSSEYLSSVLALSDDLAVEWEEAAA